MSAIAAAPLSASRVAIPHARGVCPGWTPIFGRAAAHPYNARRTENIVRAIHELPLRVRRSDSRRQKFSEEFLSLRFQGVTNRQDGFAFYRTGQGRSATLQMNFLRDHHRSGLIAASKARIEVKPTNFFRSRPSRSMTNAVGIP